jgi:predicted ATPase
VTRTRTLRTLETFVRRVRLDEGAATGRYPFSLPAITWLGRSGGLDLAPGVTFLVGENGTG